MFELNSIAAFEWKYFSGNVLLQRIHIYIHTYIYIYIYTVLDRIKWTECKFRIIFSFICYVRNKLKMLKMFIDIESIFLAYKIIKRMHIYINEQTNVYLAVIFVEVTVNFPDHVNHPERRLFEQPSLREMSLRQILLGGWELIIRVRSVH